MGLQAATAIHKVKPTVAEAFLGCLIAFALAAAVVRTRGVLLHSFQLLYGNVLSIDVLRDVVCSQ